MEKALHLIGFDSEGLQRNNYIGLQMIFPLQCR